MKHNGGNIIIVSLYVDDSIYTSNNYEMFEGLKESTKRLFTMTDLGKIRYFLEVEVKSKNAGIFIHQQKYSKEILTRFVMDQYNKMCNPIVQGCKLTKDENGNLIDAINYNHIVGCEGTNFK